MANRHARLAQTDGMRSRSVARVCSDCKGCGVGRYDTGCTGTKNSECNDCTNCASTSAQTKYRKSGCEGKSESVCASCGAGRYSLESSDSQQCPLFAPKRVTYVGKAGVETELSPTSSLGNSDVDLSNVPLGARADQLDLRVEIPRSLFTTGIVVWCEKLGTSSSSSSSSGGDWFPCGANYVDAKYNGKTGKLFRQNKLAQTHYNIDLKSLSEYTTYRLTIVPTHKVSGSTVSYDDLMVAARSYYVKTGCGCKGYNNGAPVSPNAVQSWSQDGLTTYGNSWQFSWTDASACEADGIGVRDPNKGNGNYVPLLGMNGLPGCRISDNVVVATDPSMKQAISPGKMPGTEVEFCLFQYSSNSDFQSDETCVKKKLQWVGRVAGHVASLSGKEVAGAKVWLTSPTWDGWQVFPMTRVGDDGAQSLSSMQTNSIDTCKQACVTTPLCAAVQWEKRKTACKLFSREQVRESNGELYAGVEGSRWSNHHSLYIHRAMGITDSESSSSLGFKTNFQINMMTDAFETKDVTFDVHVQKTTNGDEHIFDQPSAVTVTHMNQAFTSLSITDRSSVILSGHVRPSQAATCGVSGVTVVCMAKDSKEVIDTARTNAKGHFSLSVPRNLELILVPSLVDEKSEGCRNVTTRGAHCSHSFVRGPGVAASISISNDHSDYDFLDTTTVKVNVGAYASMCEFPIARVAKVTLTPQACPAEKIEVDITQSSGTQASIDVPAQSYSAALSISASDAIDGIKSAAVLEHLSLSDQQHQKVDATFGPEHNVTFMYRKAPLVDAVLPSSVPQCKDSFITMRQGANVTSYITLREMYGNGRVCAHVPGKVKVFDSVSLSSSPCHPSANGCFLNIEMSPHQCRGKECSSAAATLRMIPRDPNPFKSGVEGEQPHAYTLIARYSDGPTGLHSKDFFTRIVVTGHRNRGDGFSLRMPDYIPSLIIHDPPGGRSYVAAEKSVTYSNSYSVYGGTSVDKKKAFRAGLRTGTPKTTVCAGGLVGSVCTEGSENSVWADAMGHEIERAAFRNDNEERVSTTLSRTFQTSVDANIPGAMADLVIIPAITMKFSITDVVDVSAETCEISVSETLAWEPSADFNSMAATTIWTIDNKEIPKIENNIRILRETMAGHPDGGSEEDKKKVELLESYLEGWHNVTALNARIYDMATADYGRENALDSSNCNGLNDEDCKSTAGCTLASSGDCRALQGSISQGGSSAADAEQLLKSQQIHFVGGNGPTSLTYTQTKSDTAIFTMKVDKSRLAGLSAGAKLSLFGIGTELETSGSVEFTVEVGTSRVLSKEETTTTTIVLRDDTLGDYFDVNILRDPIFGTPLFKVQSGASMCPHEPRTVARQAISMTVDSPDLLHIPPDEGRLFSLRITNLSPTLDNTNFILYMKRESNPFGLEIRAFGSEFGTDLLKGLGYGEKILTFQVSRGHSSTHFNDYPPLEFVLESNCEHELQIASDGVLFREPVRATAQIQVSFIEPCDGIEFAGQLHDLADTDNGWVLGGANANEGLDITFRNTNHHSRAWRDSPRVKEVRMQYRSIDASTWTDYEEDLMQHEDEDGFVNLRWMTSSLSDGDYAIRAIVKCSASSPPNRELDMSVSPQIFGRIDSLTKNIISSQNFDVRAKVNPYALRRPGEASAREGDRGASGSPSAQREQGSSAQVSGDSGIDLVNSAVTESSTILIAMVGALMALLVIVAAMLTVLLRRIGMGATTRASHSSSGRDATHGGNPLFNHVKEDGGEARGVAWKMVIDEKSKQPYYVNQNDGRTSWHIPSDDDDDEDSD
eukprot:g1596.t1